MVAKRIEQNRKTRAQDLDKYKGVDKLTGSRKTVYENVVDQVEKLQALFQEKCFIHSCPRSRSCQPEP